MKGALVGCSDEELIEDAKDLLAVLDSKPNGSAFLLRTSSF